MLSCCGVLVMNIREKQILKYYMINNSVIPFEFICNGEDSIGLVLNYGLEQKVVVPKKHEGVPVTEIWPTCFMANDDIESVIIQNGITAIY